MAILPIRKLGDPVLREIARPVERFDDTLRRICEDMLQTMYDAPGVGLAAPQVGVASRFFVYDDGEGHEGFVANPELDGFERYEPQDEGCLSIPGEAEEVERAAKVWVRALDYHGKPFEIEGTELLAIALQHEIDHLDGTLFVDHLSSLKRELIRRRMRKVKAERDSEGTDEIRRAPRHESAL